MRGVHRLAKAILAALEVLGVPRIPDEDARGGEQRR
jgi:hypothetical protein